MECEAGRTDWRWPARLLPAIVLGAAVLALVPVALWWADANRAGFIAQWVVWGWGSVVGLGLGTVIVILTKGGAARQLVRLWRRTWGGMRAPLLVSLAALLLAALALGVCLLLFAGRPRNVDGFAQLFQARIFLAGRLWLPTPAQIAHFGILHMGFSTGRWFSQFPPGQPLVLALGLKLGAWWIPNPFIAAALVVTTWRVAKWVGGETTARLTLLLLVISPFVIAISASEMNHLPAATLGMAAAAAATFLDRDRWPPWAVAAGIALGFMTAFRPLDAVAAAVPVLLITLFSARRPVLALAVIAVAGAVSTMPTLWYNAHTTGHWLQFGYSFVWGPEHSLGFHAVPFGVPLTPKRAVGLTALDFHDLDAYLFDFPFPTVLLVAAGWLLGRRGLTRRDAVPIAGAGMLSALLFFYWHRDILFGPRLIFSAVPWYVLITARAVVLLRRSGREWRPGVSFGLAGVTTVAVAALVGVATITPDRIQTYGATTELNLRPAREAQAAGIHDAVVVVPSGWGSRLASRMWQLGVSMRRSTKLYARIDACTLEQTLDTATDSDWAPGRVNRVLDSLAARDRPGIPAGLTPDPGIRLQPGPIPHDCGAEIALDRWAFIPFAPDLYLNNAALDGDVVWARDLRDRNAALFARYPGRRFYRWVPPRFYQLTAQGGPIGGPPGAR